MTKLAGKVAVITGGNSGIGLATAQLFKENGATVITNARNEKRLAQTKEQHPDLFSNIIQADVTKLDEVSQFFQTIGEQYGKIDVLFLNAGIGIPAPLEQVTEDQFDYEFDVNVKGVFFSVQKALPYFTEGSSVILNTSIVNQKGMAGFSVYSATKAAVRSFARTLSAELIGQGIRVNAVSPGPIETPFFSKTGMTEEQIGEVAQNILKGVPMGRFGKAREVANYVLFLASEDSSYMIGTEVEVDGGMATL